MVADSVQQGKKLKEVSQRGLFSTCTYEAPAAFSARLHELVSKIDPKYTALTNDDELQAVIMFNGCLKTHNPAESFLLNVTNERDDDAIYATSLTPICSNIYTLITPDSTIRSVSQSLFGLTVVGVASD